MSTVYARFGTLLGAVVELLPTDENSFQRWHYRGCGASAVRLVPGARNEANDHAGQCRALPQPDDVPRA